MIKEVYFTSFQQIEVIADRILNNEEIQILADGLPFVSSFLTSVKNKHYRLLLAKPIDLGRVYSIIVGTKEYEINPLRLVDDPDFDDRYFDNGILGAIYSRKATTFRVWAPLAKNVNLRFKRLATDDAKIFKMSRQPNGTYELTVKGDLDSYLYQYQVTNFNTTMTSNDPYSLATLHNSRYSVVIDISKKVKATSHLLPHYTKPTEAIIFETHVRDFTKDPLNHVNSRGTFLGFLEEPEGSRVPEAFSYLKFLSPTHIQLLPLHDCATIDEKNIDGTYNWGYDPNNYFAIENTLSSDCKNPYASMNEFQMLINKCHANGIRVVLDIVLNHIYEHSTSNLQRIVPFYYFRTSNYSTMSNGSFCGNEIASERPMGRKLILDCLTYLAKTFDLDGYRFDHMGLMDIKTNVRVNELMNEIKPNFLIYGEGWIMPSVLPEIDRAIWPNSFYNPNSGFFNDAFRNILKGDSWSERGGYLLDDPGYLEGFEFVFKGSCVKNGFEPRFVSASQTINYIECHDNEVIYDYINLRFGVLSPETIMKRIELMNLVVAMAFGIPFFHMGQEIGQTKNNHHNTYNIGDELNMMKYCLLEERFAYATRFKNMIALRKKLTFLHHDNPYVLKNIIKIMPLNATNTVLKIMFNEHYLPLEMEKFALVINTKFDDATVNVSEYSHYYSLHDKLELRELPPTKSVNLKESGYLILVKLH